MGAISSAKRPFPDEGTAVLDEPPPSRMRPGSNATTASKSLGKRKSSEPAVPEGGAQGGEEVAPPSVPASKYAHGTLRPGADGKSQWRVQEQPGGAACCWQRVVAAEPRGARRPPVLAVKRPPEAAACRQSERTLASFSHPDIRSTSAGPLILMSSSMLCELFLMKPTRSSQKRR